MMKRHWIFREKFRQISEASRSMTADIYMANVRHHPLIFKDLRFTLTATASIKLQCALCTR